jgi:hypothetical protein
LHLQVKKPVPFMAAADFTPMWAKISHPAEKEGDTKMPDLPTFLASMDAMAFAYHAADIWPYAAFKGHIRVLHEVAANAAQGDKKRRHVLCQFYDELARKEWAELAARGDCDFSVADACQTIDRDILESARREYDVAWEPKATSDAYEVVQPAGKGGSGKSSEKGRRNANKNWEQLKPDWKQNSSSYSQSSWKQNKKHKGWH